VAHAVSPVARTRDRRIPAWKLTRERGITLALAMRMAVDRDARRRRLRKIALVALVGVPWIPLAAALYAWMH
jgi:hypothetical protein